MRLTGADGEGNVGEGGTGQGMVGQREDLGGGKDQQTTLPPNRIPTQASSALCLLNNGHRPRGSIRSLGAFHEVREQTFPDEALAAALAPLDTVSAILVPLFHQAMLGFSE